MAKHYKNPAGQDMIEIEAKEDCFFCQGKDETCCCSEAQLLSLNFWGKLYDLRINTLPQLISLIENSDFQSGYPEPEDRGINDLVSILTEEIEQVNQLVQNLQDDIFLLTGECKKLTRANSHLVNQVAKIRNLKQTNHQLEKDLAWWEKHSQQETQLKQSLQAKNSRISAKLGKQNANARILAQSKQQLVLEKDQLLAEKASQQVQIATFRKELTSAQKTLLSISQALGFTNNATEAEIFAKIAELMKRPDTDTIVQKDQKINNYSEKLHRAETNLATSQLAEQETKQVNTQLSRQLSQTKEEKASTINHLATVKQQLKESQRGLALGGSLGGTVLFFLLVYLVLLKRRVSREILGEQV